VWDIGHRLYREANVLRSKRPHPVAHSWRGGVKAKRAPLKKRDPWCPGGSAWGVSTKGEKSMTCSHVQMGPPRGAPPAPILNRMVRAARFETAL